MHKSTKLTTKTRRIIYGIWCRGGQSFRGLARRYQVDKNIIRKVVSMGRLGDFTVHDSANRRYRTIEYGLRRLARTEERVAVRLAKAAARGYWTDREVPGELVHGDTKRLPYAHKDVRGGGLLTREVLYVAVDDATRWLFADILPDKSGESSAAFFESCVSRVPFLIGCHYSDNGSEYRGIPTHPLVSLCAQLGIAQKFTKVRHPWTNGKAERVIRTLCEEWLTYTRGLDRYERRRSLFEYVDRYNHLRPHRSLGGLTPAAKLEALLKSGDNA